MTLTQRLKISQSMTGSRNGNFKGYKLSEGARLRRTKTWIHTKREVLARDNYKCVECGENGKCDHCGHVELHVDHIESVLSRPDLFFEQSNLRTLCKNCHEKTKNFGRRAFYCTGGAVNKRPELSLF